MGLQQETDTLGQQEERSMTSGVYGDCGISWSAEADGAGSREDARKTWH